MEEYNGVRLGDIFRPKDNYQPYMDMTVKQISFHNGDITLFRPYTETADFSYTGGVICYVGFEEFTVSYKMLMDHYTLVRRGRELK